MQLDTVMQPEALDDANPTLWLQLYQVGLWAFGENFPEPEAAPAEQVFSLVTAAAGLAAFALILALVEQVRHR